MCVILVCEIIVQWVRRDAFLNVEKDGILKGVTGPGVAGLYSPTAPRLSFSFGDPETHCGRTIVPRSTLAELIARVGFFLAARHNGGRIIYSLASRCRCRTYEFLLANNVKSAGTELVTNALPPLDRIAH